MTICHDAGVDAETLMETVDACFKASSSGSLKTPGDPRWTLISQDSRSAKSGLEPTMSFDEFVEVVRGLPGNVNARVLVKLLYKFTRWGAIKFSRSLALFWGTTLLIHSQFFFVYSQSKPWFRIGGPVDFGVPYWEYFRGPSDFVTK